MSKKTKRQRRAMVSHIEDAITKRLDAVCAGAYDGEDARIALFGWSSQKTNRFAAQAAVAVLEAGREGAELVKENGDV